MKSFGQIAEEVGFILTEAAEKQFLVKLQRNLTTDVVNAWHDSAKSEIAISKIEKYNDTTMKVTVTKGSAAALKRTWNVMGVQNFTALTSTHADSPVEMTYYNIRK